MVPRRPAGALPGNVSGVWLARGRRKVILTVCGPDSILRRAAFDRFGGFMALALWRRIRGTWRPRQLESRVQTFSQLQMHG